MIAGALIVLQLVELDQGLVHAGLVHLELFLLFAKERFEIGTAIPQLGLGILQCARLVPQRFLEICHLAVVLGEHGGELVPFAAL